MLVKAGSGAHDRRHPGQRRCHPGRGAGHPAGRNTTTWMRWNSCWTNNRGQVAAVIVEPVAANMGVVPPAPGFLPGLRRLCDAHGALLIFDEVITGFRLALGGAMEYFGVEADLVTYRQDHRRRHACGRLWRPPGDHGPRLALRAGLPGRHPFSGNPVAMAAGIANLTQLRDHPEIYTAINQMAEALAQGLRQALPGCTVNQVGSLVCPFFTPGPVTDFATARQSDTGRYAAYFKHMLSRASTWPRPSLRPCSSARPTPWRISSRPSKLPAACRSPDTAGTFYRQQKRRGDPSPFFLFIAGRAA